MEEVPEQITVHKPNDGQNTSEYANINQQSRIPWLRNPKWCLQMLIFSLFVLFGQSVATLLGRQYFDKGGNSKWIAALVQTAGFPALIPFLFLSSIKNQTSNDDCTARPSALSLASFSISLGVFIAVTSVLYAIGLQYLPVSTFSLICASQLGFNAFSSYFLNSQKITPFILNSLVLLTMSSILLVFHKDSEESNGSTKESKYAIGFICTVGASAGYALMLSGTQFVFRRNLKGQSFRVVIEIIIYMCLVSTFAILVGLFVSGDWKTIGKEMRKFELGKISYVMNLVWTAMSWQVFNIGTVGLIFKVSSLFSNVIGTLGLPIVPILAVFIFHDKMTGVKVVSLLLAIWGFVSYAYQHYVDDFKSRAETKNVEATIMERI